MKLSTVKRSITLWIIFLFILISAYWAGVEQVAMRRESDLQASPQTAIAQAEVRVILIGQRW